MILEGILKEKEGLFPTAVIDRGLVGLTPASTIVILEGILKEKVGLFPTR